MPGEPSQTPRAETRRLAAIMFTDIVGFSRQMGADEARCCGCWTSIIRSSSRRWLTITARSSKLSAMPSWWTFPLSSMPCSAPSRFRRSCGRTTPSKRTREQIHVRIGIHLGDIVQRDGDVFGDGVNIASRLQALAEPDTICISHIVYRRGRQETGLGHGRLPGQDPSSRTLPSGSTSMRCCPKRPRAFARRLQVQRLKLSRRVRPAHWLSVAGLVLIAAPLSPSGISPVPLLSTQSPAPSTQPRCRCPTNPPSSSCPSST